MLSWVEMAKLRTSLHLALVLILVSLTCGAGAGCAIAGGSCGGIVEDSGAPNTGWSGIAIARGVSEPGATAGKGERLTAAVLDAVTAATCSGLSSSSAAPASPAPPAASTPLYLSHCSFLC